jgi:glutamate-ammonia-ligase adenylyltransferase
MRASDLLLSSDLAPEDAHAFLQAAGFLDPSAADLALGRLTGLAGSRERLAAILPDLLAAMSRSADPDAALAQFEAFLEASVNSGALLSYLEASPLALEVLVTLLGSSPFLTQLLLRSPEYFYWLMEEGRLDAVCKRDYFRRQAEEATHPFAHESEKALEALRRLRRRETLRIAAQDLLGRTTLDDSVAQVSDLADCILDFALQIVSRRLFGDSAPFAVMGLGKLGGRELNFSSDVDLIYIHADDAGHDSMLTLGREYTRALTELTGNGRLYRVDLRLRPGGKTGEIAYSMDASLHYYETWADTFDRLALMKCRHVAGDQAVGEAFVHAIEGFVFRKYWDTAALEEIRWIKLRGDQRLRRRDEISRNIKLGEGGIREIEFFVQAFQLLYGGLHPEIRSPNTLGALHRLVDHGFILPKDYQTLRRAYIHFRDLEHKLQLVHDLQTHTLPESDAELERCARRMGYRGKPEDPERSTPLLWFTRDLEAHTQAVRKIYASFFTSDADDSGLAPIALNPDLTKEEILERLRVHGVSQPEEFHSGLVPLLEASSYPYSPSRMRNLLANLLPRLVECSVFTDRPGLMLSRLDRVCEALGARAPLYSELIENRAFSQRLLKLLAASEFLSETLIRSPELLDVVASPPSPDLLPDALNLVEKGGKGRNAQNALRAFKRREEFKLAVGESLESGAIETRHGLTRLAEICLRLAIEATLERTPRLRSQRFAVIAMGKFGGLELTYHSDLDLVFVYDDNSPSASAYRLNEWVKEIRDELEGYTEEGAAYRLDFRLRPEGKHGPLAVPLSVLCDYFVYRAESWERLAWVKSRVVNGKDLEIPHFDLVFRAPLAATERQRLAHIRERKELEIGQEDQTGRFDFKVGAGGLLDIQFVVQYLQLEGKVDEPNTLSAIDKLVAAGMLTQDSAQVLRQGLRFLFRIESAQRLLQATSAHSFSKVPQECETLARYTGFASGDELVTRYLEETRRVREVYLGVFPKPR